MGYSELSVSLSTLCQRCGLCCDGNLFSHVPLQGGEVAAMRRNGIEVVQRADGSQALVQRCAALEGRCCTVYADRPERCRRYGCLLYTALAEGEVDLDEALAIIDEAHALIAGVDAALRPEAGEGASAVMQRASRADHPAFGGPLSPEARAARERADTFLDRHFRGRR